MKSMVLYPYPPELDGISIQGDMLYKGLLKNEAEVVRCDRGAVAEKELLYKTFKPDVVIGIGYWADAPRLIEHPLEYGVEPVPWLNADGWVANYHELLNSLPLMLTTSNWVKETYYRDGVRNKEIYPMPIGIDTSQMRPLPKDDPRVLKVREMLGVKPDEKMILTSGGDTTSKGFQEVLQALGKINGDFPNWKYIGKTWEKYKPLYHYKKEMEIMKDLEIRKKVDFLDGALSREFMCYLINACDVYAAPSRIEGFGMIQVEAMACGKPVLSIDAMGIKDTIIHNETGFLAKVGEEIKLEEEWAYKWMGFEKKHKIEFDEPKTLSYRVDVDDLSKYLYRMLSDDELVLKMGENARKHVVKNFDYVKTSKDINDLVEKKLGLGVSSREEATVSVQEH
jgi:glycosyltransferase involved in cell wall biosynthesis